MESYEHFVRTEKTEPEAAKAEKSSDLTEEERIKARSLERRRQWAREYYRKNRDKIRAQQREYYNKRGREYNAARVREYRRKNKEKVAANRKEYRAKNRDKFLAWGKEYYRKNKEIRSEKAKAYWQANRERLLARKREYNARNRDKRREYYEKNKYRLCNHNLNCYSLNAIEKIQKLCPEAVNDYTNRYPFEEYADRPIKACLRRYNIHPSQEMYADCYDAGMIAYLYSIHRCAFMQYSYTKAYINKMIRVCIICALVIYNDARNLCRANGFREIRLDAAKSQCWF